jgi:hypothetical protein
MHDAHYCYACGGRLSNGPRFCPHCGAAQGPVQHHRSTVPVVVVALMLLFFFPLGLLVMWTSTDWDDDVKWAISGLFFPPLWLRFLWKIWWLPYVAGVLAAALTIRGALLGGLSWTGGFAILAVIAVVLFITWSVQRSKQPDAVEIPDLTEAAEQALTACDEVIAELETNSVLALLPTSSPELAQYGHALELRSHGRELLERSATPRDVARAERRLSEALHELESLRDSLSDRRAGNLP